MSKFTTNYNLELPDLDDKYSIEKFNANTEIIDTQMKANADAILTRQPKVTGAVSNVVDVNLPVDRVVITNTSGKLTTCKVTVTELECLSGITSNIQVQLDDKSHKSHVHDDRYYTETEIDLKLAGKQNNLTIDAELSSTSANPVQNKVVANALTGKANVSHTHDDRYYTESEMNDLLSGKQDNVTISTSDPSGGKDGDIWFKYE